MGNFIFNETKSLTLTKEDIECSCVYIFWLGQICQYVGLSSVGLSRPLASNHIMNGKPYDRIEIFKQEDAETARLLEERWIYKYSPQFNTLGIVPSYRKSGDSGRPCIKYDISKLEFVVYARYTMFKQTGSVHMQQKQEEVLRTKNRNEAKQKLRDIEREEKRLLMESMKAKAKQEVL